MVQVPNVMPYLLCDFSVKIILDLPSSDILHFLSGRFNSEIIVQVFDDVGDAVAPRI